MNIYFYKEDFWWLHKLQVSTCQNHLWLQFRLQVFWQKSWQAFHISSLQLFPIVGEVLPQILSQNEVWTLTGLFYNIRVLHFKTRQCSFGCIFRVTAQLLTPYLRLRAVVDKQDFLSQYLAPLTLGRNSRETWAFCTQSVVKEFNVLNQSCCPW